MPLPASPGEENNGASCANRPLVCGWRLVETRLILTLVDSLTALAHCSGVLEKPLPREGGGLDQRWPLEVFKGVHVAGVLADDRNRLVRRR